MVREPSVSRRWLSHFWAQRVTAAGVASFWGDGPSQISRSGLAGIDGQVHAVAELGAVLKEGVFPGGASALLVHRVGGGGSTAAPDGGAAGGVGDVHPVAEELGDQLDIGSLAAAGAGAGELEERLLELAALHGLLGEGEGLFGDVLQAVVKDLLLVQLALQGLHGESLGLGRAGLDAGAAAGAVQHGNGHGIGVDLAALAPHVVHLGALGGIHHFVGIHDHGTDAGVGTDIGADVALDAVVLVPGRNLDGDAPLFKGSGALGQGAVGPGHELGDGDGVAAHGVGGDHDVLDVLGQLRPVGVDGGGDGLVLGVGPADGHGDLLDPFDAGIHGVVVAHDDVHTLVAVALDDGVLHVLDGLVHGDDLGQLEEGGLEDGVGPVAHAQFDGLVSGVADEDPDVVLGQVTLGGGGQVLLQLLEVPGTVEQEGAAGLDVLDDVELLHVGSQVAGHEVGLGDIVGSLDLVLTKTQVADGHAAGLFGVVLEVRLNLHVGVVADDLDGVLVGAHGTVAAQTPELDLDGALGRGVGGLVLLQRQVGHVVHEQ